MKITWLNKLGLIPKTVRVNQCWDDDLNEIKASINNNDDASLSSADGTQNGFAVIGSALIEKVGADRTTIELNDKCVYKRFAAADEILFGATFTNNNGTGDSDTENISNWTFEETITTG